jgi:pyruvate ferredoxin oxidoreductase alpha subunit
VKAVGVIDRDYSFGSAFYSGVLSSELRSALYPLANRPRILSFIAGLGGREVNTNNVIDVADRLLKAASGGHMNDQDTDWLGVRE